MGIPTFEKKGYEADDIIYSITACMKENQCLTGIVSSDKDLMQLVDDTVCIVKMRQETLILTEEEVQEKWGVPPHRIRDLLALAGDSADNIPGVPRIGVKTAAKLLQSYESLEGIYEHIDELKGKQKETLENNKDKALLSYDLVQLLDCREELKLTLDQCLQQNYDPDAFSDFCSSFSLQSLTKFFLKKNDSAPKEEDKQDETPFDICSEDFETVDQDTALFLLNQLSLFFIFENEQHVFFCTLKEPSGDVFFRLPFYEAKELMKKRRFFRRTLFL